MELVDGDFGVGFPACERVNVEDGHLLLEWVGVDVVDFGVGFGMALSGYPGDVAVDDKDHVGCLNGIFNAVAES